MKEYEFELDSGFVLRIHDLHSTGTIPILYLVYPIRHSILDSAMSQIPSKHWFYQTLLPLHTSLLHLTTSLQTESNPPLHLYIPFAKHVLTDIQIARHWLRNVSDDPKWYLAKVMVMQWQTSALSMAGWIAEEGEAMEIMIQEIGEEGIRIILGQYLNDMLNCKGDYTHHLLLAEYTSDLSYTLFIAY